MPKLKASGIGPCCVGLILWACVTSGGCAIGAIARINSAEAALTDAEQAGAKNKAIYRYTLASLYLEKAREEWSYAHMGVANDLGGKAEDLANDAKREARGEIPPPEPPPVAANATPTPLPAPGEPTPPPSPLSAPSLVAAPPAPPPYVAPQPPAPPPYVAPPPGPAPVAAPPPPPAPAPAPVPEPPMMPLPDDLPPLPIPPASPQLQKSP